MNLKINSFVLLPENLIKDLDAIGMSKAEKNHSLKYIHNLSKRSFRLYGTTDSFIETPSNYFRKVFNSKYMDWLKKLIDAKIIISSNSYSNYNNNIYSKHYCINNIYYNPPIMLPLFDKPPLKTVGYEFKMNIKDDNYTKIRNMVTEDFNRLKIDYSELLKIINKEVEEVKISIFKTNEEVERDSMNVCFREWNKEKMFWMSKENAIAKAKDLNRMLIQDESRFYIMDEYEFISMKKRAMYFAYRDSVLRMEKGIFNINRNTTNNRLDTNLTNMSKLLTDEICRQNNLVQFDLANAQFAILSYILEKQLQTEDFFKFKEQSYLGCLYEYVQEKLQVKDRKTAKIMMFELMFSKETFNSPLKERLKTLFPTVVSIVDKYKTEHGYNTFSVMLQKKESEIFIDGLWEVIKKKKMFCMTKHDCLIVREEDAKKVEAVIKEYFEKINFKGKIIKE